MRSLRASLQDAQQRERTGAWMCCIHASFHTDACRHTHCRHGDTEAPRRKAAGFPPDF